MSNSLYYFNKLIIIENVCCINRNYLIKNKLKRKIVNYISTLAPIILIIALIIDITTVTDLYLRAFQVVLISELLDLTLSARLRRKTFETIARLDEKCGIDDIYSEDIKRNVTIAATISIASVILDAVGLYLLDIRPTVIVVLVILFSAHDTELAFFTLLVDCMNLRLSTLKDQHPNTGCRIYRYVLLVTSHINEEFTPNIFIILGVTIFTTVIYSVIIFLADPAMMLKISVYLIWREMKSLYSLWRACSAAAKTEAICRKLAFHLATQLALDTIINKEHNFKLYKTIHRWYTTVLSCRPCYVCGSIFTIGLSVPLIIVDISINYMLIIVQIYIAYK